MAYNLHVKGLGMNCFYHHCMDLADVTFGEIHPSPVHTFRKLRSYENDPSCNSIDHIAVASELVPNWWLEAQVGFYPLFMAVGSTREDVHMTGYANQWRRAITGIPDQNSKKGYRWVLRKKGEAPNYVLFSYKNPPNDSLRFVDYGFWFLALNSSHKDYLMTDQERRWIMKPSYKPSDWLRKARKEPHHVMAVIDRLDLRKADRIWVRNEATFNTLIDMGFKAVRVKRIPIQKD